MVKNIFYISFVNDDINFNNPSRINERIKKRSRGEIKLKEDVTLRVANVRKSNVKIMHFASKRN